MLVTFTSNEHGDITMFGDVAERLLEMMGHSGTIPSAVSAEHVSEALENLKKALEIDPDEVVHDEVRENDDEEEKEPPVSLARRAFPLIQMLTAAAEANSHVMWYKK
jgi:uncharacterized protein DUF1840